MPPEANDDDDEKIEMKEEIFFLAFLFEWKKEKLFSFHPQDAGRHKAKSN